jgi:hypothetical protein
MMRRRIAAMSFLLGSLLACSSVEESAEVPGTSDAGMPPMRVIEDDLSPRLQSDRQRLIADLLFEGLQALDADHLLTPAEGSAHSRFRRVLAYEPDNEIALQGIQDIVLRYVELSQQASLRGQFEQAATLLDRARFVDASNPAIAEAGDLLEAERNSGDLFFELEQQTMDARGDQARAELAEIARQAKVHDAFLQINAPSDGLARWMYGAMREAVPGYRLRGNIELAPRTSIRLRMPESE